VEEVMKRMIAVLLLAAPFASGACMDTPGSPDQVVSAPPTTTPTTTVPPSGDPPPADRGTCGTGQGQISVLARRLEHSEYAPGGARATLRVGAETGLTGRLYARVWLGPRHSGNPVDFPLTRGEMRTDIAVIVLGQPGTTVRITVDVELDVDGDGTADKQCDGGVDVPIPNPPPETNPPPTTTVPPSVCSVNWDAYLTVRSQTYEDRAEVQSTLNWTPGGPGAEELMGRIVGEITLAGETVRVGRNQTISRSFSREERDRVIEIVGKAWVPSGGEGCAKVKTDRVTIPARPPEQPRLECSVSPREGNVGDEFTFRSNRPGDWGTDGDPGSAANTDRFRTRYRTAGRHTATVRSGDQSARCSVEVEERRDCDDCDDIRLRVEDRSRNGELKLDIRVSRPSSRPIEVKAVAENGSATLEGSVSPNGGTFSKSAPSPPRWYRVTVTAFDGEGRRCEEKLRICF
jgi:hypothetical protein